MDDERRRSQHLSETVNDLESELNEERARGRLAEERISILRAQSDREEAERHKLEQRKNQRELRLDPNVLQMEQQTEMYKNEVSSSLIIIFFKFNHADSM